MQKELTLESFQLITKHADEVVGGGDSKLECYDYWLDGEYLASKENSFLYNSEITGEPVYETTYYTIY